MLRQIDEYYADQHGEGDGVASQVARQLADPTPRDASVARQLSQYRQLAPRWHDWDEIRKTCRAVAQAMTVPDVAS